ncbi:hypothetical protein KI387_010107, partial [Taxus chinensis]
LKKSLKAVFAQFGKIVDVIASKTLKHRGQAWVVFDEVSAATNALQKMQGFPFYDKPMRIQYAKTKSDAIAKADGTFVPREKRKRQDERAERRRRDQQHHEAQQAGAILNAAYPSAYGAPALDRLLRKLETSNSNPLTPLKLPTQGVHLGSQMPFQASKPNLPEAPAPPNNILFIQNLPHETTPMMLQMLFCQYHGFKEVRMIEAKPGIAFVEYGDEMQATVAMQALQGFKITPQNPM